MTDEPLIHVENVLDGRGAIIRLNRPKALNALNGPLLDALDAALDTLESKAEVRVVILAGNAKSFSAGADLKEESFDRMERVRRMHRLVLRLRDYPAASIAAIEGWALGGGLELAMACTFRVAAPGARLGLPEVHLGAIPSYGGTQLASRLLGPVRALELICTGEPILAEQAARIGLVNWLAASDGAAVECALDYAAKLSVLSRAALGAARRAVLHGIDLPLEDGLALEAETCRTALDGQTPEGIAAFRERETKAPR